MPRHLYSISDLIGKICWQQAIVKDEVSCITDERKKAKRKKEVQKFACA